MRSIEALSKEKRQIISRFSGKSNLKASIQLLTTLVPYVTLWSLAVVSLSVSYWLTALCIFVLCLVLLRVFVLMHECGHNSLFATSRYNRIAGFVLGCLCGMPQYVWAKNHAYHHATNGNWDKYRGPLATLTLDEYHRLAPRQQRIYRMTRNIAFAPIGGFMYLVFSPRYNWLKGNIALARHILQQKRRDPQQSLRAIVDAFEPRYWKDSAEYRHMTGNNLVVLSAWLVMSLVIGPAAFFTIYLISLSFSGAGGIILFTVQHNFEDSWAADEAHWNYNRAAVHGTSFLVLPRWLNWFTADIAYHHVHHLSASIPNYNLAACHEAYSHLFTDVKRISLWEVPAALKNNLWDVSGQRITNLKAVSAGDMAAVNVPLADRQA